MYLLNNNIIYLLMNCFQIYIYILAILEVHNSNVINFYKLFKSFFSSKVKQLKKINFLNFNFCFIWKNAFNWMLDIYSNTVDTFFSAFDIANGLNNFCKIKQ